MNNLTINCVVAEYMPKQNATKETKVKTVHSIEEAEAWINSINKPAMTYIDGMQDHDRFMDLCCLYNKKYWSEHRKERD